MKTYLVTGAAGFIGAKLAASLIDGGHRVVTVDNLSTGFITNIPKGVIFYEGDCQTEDLIKRLENYTFETIFHLAGQSSGEISFDNPVYDLQTNAQSTILLLKLALATGCKKFVYASSMSVYGNCGIVPVSEGYRERPESFYGVGKLASEHYLRIYQNFGITCTALRLFNVYGPGQNMENLRQGMVSIYLSQALKDNRIHVKGSGERFRDFVFIDDVVEAFTLCLDLQRIEFQAFNICSGVKTTVHELTSKVISELDMDIPVIFEESTQGDQFGIYGNSELFRKETTWEPKVNLDEGLLKMVTWAKTRLDN